MNYLLGIDVGTSGTKTLLVNQKGEIVCRAVCDYPLMQPRPGWAEQDPHQWWEAVVSSISQVLSDSKVDPRLIKGIGLSGQMHGSVFLDQANNVLRPAILWCDQRTQAECDYITGKIGAKRLIALTCNQALTGFTAPKIIWLRKHEPAIYDRCKKILLPKDYIRFCLTGEFATEVSDASGTLLFDVKKRTWSKPVLSALQIDPALLPPCYESPEVTGKVNQDTAAKTGLREGTPVVGGGGDQAAGAVGNGIVETGIISASLGTSGVMFAFSNHPSVDNEARLHTFCHAVPGKWHVMGVMLSAGGSFRWLRDSIGLSEVNRGREEGVDPYELLTAEAETAAPGCEGLIFLPYLMGERTPYADPNAKGVFFGLSLRHRRAELIRSVMEGVTYGMRDSLELVQNLGIKVTQIRASGGGARSKLWRQIQADVYNKPIARINVDEGPAFGVALLAGVGTGVYRTVAEACEKTIKVTETLKPNPERVKTYDKFYRLYRSLYPTLKKKFDEISGLIG